MNIPNLIYKSKSSHLRNSKVDYFNFWDGQSADEIWFSSFLKSRGFFQRFPKEKFAFFSTLGNVNVLKADCRRHLFDKHRRRIFFTGENVHYDAFKAYKNNLLDYHSIELSLGFDSISDDRYLRFPLWILEMFPADASTDVIKQRCEQLSHQQLDDNRNRFCAMVSGTSTLFGTESMDLRSEIVNQMNTVFKVDCAGRFLHNTDDLQVRFNDNKAEFLKRYKFFICPENTSVDGYVTEKVFHSIGSGCIPIYRGSLNNPEPDVLNHDAILFWEKDADNSQLIQKVDELWQNPARYKEFFEQPRLQPNAWEVVAHYFDTLEQKLHEICRNS